MALAQALAQQGAGADTDGEHHQQRRRNLLIAMQHFLGQAWKLAQKHGAEKPHPADAQQRAEHHDVPVREFQVAPGFADRVPVDLEARVGGGRGRYVARDNTPHHRQQYTANRHIAVAGAGYRHQQAAGHVAQQNGDEGAHLHHAVATGQFAFRQDLRQQGELDRAEQGGMQAHQKHAAQQHQHIGHQEAPGRQQHDEDLQVLDEADHGRLVMFVGELAAGGREQQKRQDEQGANHQARHGRRQPAHAELVGDHHGKGELEQVVVGGTRELGPEKRCEAALLEQCELVGVRVGRWHWHVGQDLGFCVQGMLLFMAPLCMLSGGARTPGALAACGSNVLNFWISG